MKLTVLGSGTSVPNPTRASSGYWLETSGGTVLLDFSASTIHRMAAEDLDWPNLGAVWISHFHLDHCGGLAPFLAGTKHATEMKGRKTPLQIFGPPGLKRLVEKFDQVNDYRLMQQPFPVEVIEIGPLERFEIMPGVEATAISTPHTPESLAIHIRDRDNTTLVYTSDMGFAKEVAAFSKYADLLLIECSFVNEKPVEKHLELAEAMYLISHAKAKRAILTHLYPQWDGVDFAAEVRKFEPACEVIEAIDGLRLEIQ